jgi:arginyl-tRNA synthetase
MGVDFDNLYYESDTYLLGKKVVEEGLQKGVFYRKDDGSVWCDLTGDGLDEKLVLRKDGTAVYMTQDIGTAIERFEDFPELSKMIYTVGNEQDYHFKVLFLILKKLGYQWAEECYHLSYGMVELPEGKMKSREGTVVDADDLMEAMVNTAREELEERGTLEELSTDEGAELSKTIGLGALKYFLLKVDPKKKILFNPKESIDLNGNTAPFIQYTHARIKALLRREQPKEDLNFNVNWTEKEHELIKLLYDFPQIVMEAADQHSPSLLCNYTYDLVKTYNSFYQSVRIFDADDDAKQMRLAISQLTASVIATSMNAIGINVPERM